MGVSFSWDEKYSVGNEEIDGQHKYMFELANSLPESIEDGSVKKTVMALYKYILKHFSAEELLMNDEKFPCAVEHMSLHNDLITQLNEITSIPFKGDEDLLKFKRFVYDWVIEHIMHQDKKFFDFIKQKQNP